MKQSVLERSPSQSVDAEGATAVEYAIMVASIAVVIIAAVIAIGLATDANFGELLGRWPG